MGVWVVAFKGLFQPYNLLVFARDEEDAWALAKEYMGDGIQVARDKGFVWIGELPARRGIICSDMHHHYGPGEATDEELAAEAAAWDSRQKKPTDAGYERVHPRTGEPLKNIPKPEDYNKG